VVLSGLIRHSTLVVRELLHLRQEHLGRDAEFPEMRDEQVWSPGSAATPAGRSRLAIRWYAATRGTRSAFVLLGGIRTTTVVADCVPKAVTEGAGSPGALLLPDQKEQRASGPAVIA
jgi:hypothetical protein